MMTTEWLLHFKKLMFRLGQVTGTPLPPPPVQDEYARQVHARCYGQHSLTVIEKAMDLVAAQWRYPSFPKVVDILDQVDAARRDPRVLDAIRIKDPSRLLEDGEPAQPTEQQKLAVAEQSARFRERMGWS